MNEILSKEINVYLGDNKTYSNRVAQGASLLGRWMLEPFNLGVAKITRAKELSLEEDVHGRDPSLTREKWIRVGRVVAGIVYCLIGAIPLIIGGILLASGNLAKRDMTYIAPKNYTPKDLDGPLKLGTFNLGALPEWITAQNLLRPLDERIDQFVSYLRSHPNEIDCLCIQELFDQTAIRTIQKKCQKIFPYMVLDVAPRTFGMNSGLAILSKYPLLSPKFRQYKNTLAEDALANKGLLSVRVQISADKQIALFNTHMQCGSSKPCYGEHRKKVFDAIPSLYKEYDDTNAVFTVGDLNASQYEDVKDSEGRLIPMRDLEENEKFFHRANLKYPITCELSDPYSVPKGTAWHKRSKYTMWNLNRPKEWTLKENELDHILAWKNRLPGNTFWLKKFRSSRASKSAIKCGARRDRPVLTRKLLTNIPQGTTPQGTVHRNIELGLCSDHVAVVGEFTIPTRKIRFRDGLTAQSSYRRRHSRPIVGTRA